MSVGEAVPATPADAEASSTHAGPARFTVDAIRTRAEWEAIVARAIDAIRRGELEKVVLAREVIVEGDQPFDVRDTFVVVPTRAARTS